MNHVQVYDKLHATSTTAEWREKVGRTPYPYIVINGAMSHTAFMTRAGLDRWLGERGLTLENDLPEEGTFGTTRVLGQYRTESHGMFSATSDEPHRMIEDDAWSQIRPVVITAAMSNGRWTLGLISEEDGIRTVHTLNPNVKSRIQVDGISGYRAMHKLMS